MSITTLATERTERTDPESASNILDELLGLAGGLGFFFMAFLAAIPGLVPTVILGAGALALLTLPLLIVGAVLGVALGLGWLLAKTTAVVLSLLTGTHR